MTINTHKFHKSKEISLIFKTTRIIEKNTLLSIEANYIRLSTASYINVFFKF